MANRDLLAIGASSGGFHALRRLVGEFPDTLPAAVFIVIHLSARFPSELDRLLSEAGPLPASFARDGDKIEKGRIFLAPAGKHLIVEADALRLGDGPRENNARPAIDPMFRSLALCCGPRSVGVVLTGALGDGASGLLTLKKAGGIAVVQDPQDAAYPEMPATALRESNPDYVVSLNDMPKLLQELLRKPAGPAVPPPVGLKYEVEVAKGGSGSMAEMDRIGRRSALTCPECHGALWELREGDLLRYRCHTGHAYTAGLVGLALDEALTSALASSLRIMEERLALARKLHAQALQIGSRLTAKSWERKIADYEREAHTLREAMRRIERISVQPFLAPESDTGT